LESLQPSCSWILDEESIEERKKSEGGKEYILTEFGDQLAPLKTPYQRNGSKWKSLPDNAISAPSLLTFRQRLKTYVLRASLPDVIVDPRFVTCHTFSGF